MNSSLYGRRVLVVEDEMIVAWLLEDMLADFGCTIVGPAARIDQALAMIKAEALDAAVLDVNLNGQQSYPLADALVTRGVPFVFVTAQRADDLPERHRHRPIVPKPYYDAAICAALASVLPPKS